MEKSHTHGATTTRITQQTHRQHREPTFLSLTDLIPGIRSPPTMTTLKRHSKKATMEVLGFRRQCTSMGNKWTQSTSRQSTLKGEDHETCAKRLRNRGRKNWRWNRSWSRVRPTTKEEAGRRIWWDQDKKTSENRCQTGQQNARSIEHGDQTQKTNETKALYI